VLAAERADEAGQLVRIPPHLRLQVVDLRITSTASHRRDSRRSSAHRPRRLGVQPHQPPPVDHQLALAEARRRQLQEVPLADAALSCSTRRTSGLRSTAPPVQQRLGKRPAALVAQSAYIGSCRVDCPLARQTAGTRRADGRSRR